MIKFVSLLYKPTREHQSFSKWGKDPLDMFSIKTIIIINDIYPGSSIHSKVVFREVLHPIELEFGKCWFLQNLIWLILSLYYINQPENISKTSVRTSVAHAAIVPHFLILPHFDIICDHITEQMLGNME